MNGICCEKQLVSGTRQDSTGHVHFVFVVFLLKREMVKIEVTRVIVIVTVSTTGEVSATDGQSVQVVLQSVVREVVFDESVLQLLWQLTDHITGGVCKRTTESNDVLHLLIFVDVDGLAFGCLFGMFITELQLSLFESVATTTGLEYSDHSFVSLLDRVQVIAMRDIAHADNCSLSEVSRMTGLTCKALALYSVSDSLLKNPILTERSQRQNQCRQQVIHFALGFRVQ